MRRVLLAAVVVLGVLAVGRPAPSQALPNPQMHPFHKAKPMGTVSYAYGYRPVDMQRAYSVPTPVGSPTIAVVDAYDNPNAESDLAVYRTQFGLPACTTANGCFTKVNQNGGTAYPAPDVGWSQEISLDIQAVSAICPNCKILLVEANSSNFTDLMAGIDYAATKTPYISNSWGTDEFNGEQNFESRFNKPGVVMAFSSGDAGYGVSYPAASKYVVGVGGTTLRIDSLGNRTSETAWSGAGSGCSLYIAKPTWQKDSGCAGRSVTDVSALADPNTGIAVYASYGSTGGNWIMMGGTSLAAPIVATLYAIAGTPAANTWPASYPYAAASSLFDVTSGSNKTSCTSYLCAGTVGYDGPTGLGAPKGVSAYAASATTPPSTTTTTAPVTTTTVAPTTTTTRPPTTTTTAVNKAPVISSIAKSCSSNTCTFTVTARDPEYKALTYAWTAGASTTRVATYTFTTTGTKTVTVGVSDGVKTTFGSKTATCYKSGTRILCI